MIRALLSGQLIPDLILKMPLDDLLKDSLAIKKEFSVFQIVKNKSVDKFFCVSKTTIQIDGSY